MVSLQYMSIPNFIFISNYKIHGCHTLRAILLLSNSERRVYCVTCFLIRDTCITFYSIVGKESSYSIYHGEGRNDASLLEKTRTGKM